MKPQAQQSQPAHAVPSWADQRSAHETAHLAEPSARTASEPSTRLIVWLAIVLSIVAGLLPIFLLPIVLPHQSPRESSVVTVLLILWILAVAIATIVILRRVVPAGATAFSAPRSRGEKILNWTALLLSLLVFSAAAVTRRPIPLWLWVCCVAVTAVVTALTLRSLSRDQRGRVAGTVYGMVIALSVLFPLMAMPRRFHAIGSLLMAIVVTAMLVLMIGAAARQRKAPVAY